MTNQRIVSLCSASKQALEQLLPPGESAFDVSHIDNAPLPSASDCLYFFVMENGMTDERLAHVRNTGGLCRGAITFVITDVQDLALSMSRNALVCTVPVAHLAHAVELVRQMSQAAEDGNDIFALTGRVGLAHAVVIHDADTAPEAQDELATLAAQLQTVRLAYGAFFYVPMLAENGFDGPRLKRIGTRVRMACHADATIISRWGAVRSAAPALAIFVPHLAPRQQ